MLATCSEGVSDSPQGKVGLSFVWFTAASASTHSDSVGNRYPSVKGCVSCHSPSTCVYAGVRESRRLSQLQNSTALDQERLTTGRSRSFSRIRPSKPGSWLGSNSKYSRLVTSKRQGALLEKASDGAPSPSIADHYPSHGEPRYGNRQHRSSRCWRQSPPRSEQRPRILRYGVFSPRTVRLSFYY